MIPSIQQTLLQNDPNTDSPIWVTLLSALIIIIAIVIVIGGAVLFDRRFRRWQSQNCFPIYFAGAMIYGRKNDSLESIFVTRSLLKGSSNHWLQDLAKEIGISNATFYTDVNLTQPLDEAQPLTGPLYIFPKIERSE